MKTPYTLAQSIRDMNPFGGRHSRLMPLVLIAGLLPAGPLSAGTWDWNVLSGNWNASASWSSATNSGTFPTSNTDGVTVNLTNGTLGTPAEATLTADWLLGSNTSVTINAHNTLTLSLDKSFQVNSATASWTNHGIIQSSSTSGRFRGTAGTKTNDGTIQALSGGYLTFWDFGTINNAGGTIQAKTGGTIRSWSSATINGGALKSEVGGTLLNDASGNSAQTITLTGVTVSNAGTYTNDQSTVAAGNGSTSIQTTLGTGTVFTNEAGAITQVLNTGSGTTTSATNRTSLFNVNSGSTFNNAGTLLIQNDATRTGTLTGQIITFTVNSAATAFTSTGTIKVIANTTAIGATATFTSAKSITNDGVVLIKGNTNNEYATFSVTGTGNDYTQSAGSGRRTVLEQGGELNVVDQVAINGGTFGGVGTVTGATTIGGDATLIVAETFAVAGTPAAGVLTFNNTLALANDSEVKFGLGLNTATSGQIVLVGASNLTVGSNVTLTLSDLTGGSWVDGTTYRLFDLGAGSISSTSFVVNFTSSGWDAVLNTGAAGTDFLDVTIHAMASVPEPSSYALFGGAVALLYAVRRRKARASTLPCRSV